MSKQRSVPAGPGSPPDQEAIRGLHRDLLERWNRRDASGMAALFADDGHVIGFDGSEMRGPVEIERVLARIFADHPTAAYVAIVREVRLLAPEVGLLRAAVGMVPPGQTELNPAVNAIQTLVAARRGGRWRVELFQNTPAAFHGRPEATEALTAELRGALSRGPAPPGGDEASRAVRRPVQPRHRSC
jgi:uncharacterized protein (TIGR02246 family)